MSKNMSRKVSYMGIQFRSLKHGEEDDVYNMLKKTYRLMSRSQFTWRFLDNPQWDFDYTIIGEIEGKIAAITFLEPQTIKFLGGTMDIAVGGVGVVNPSFRKRGYFKAMVAQNVVKTNQLKKTMFMAYVIKNQFVYPSLKKEGFFLLNFQNRYMKILNVKETFKVVITMAKILTFPEKISLNVKIAPESEESFILQLKNGKLFIKENNEDFDIKISGNIKKMIPSLIDRDFLGVLPLLLRRTIKICVTFSSLKKIFALVHSRVIS
jgi:hypothetical protein